MNKTDIQVLQDHYNQWMKLAPELAESLAKWQQAETLLKPLSEFYGSEKWRELYDSFTEQLDTQGNYSILSEDALWNAFSDHREMYDKLSQILKNSFANIE